MTRRGFVEAELQLRNSAAVTFLDLLEVTLDCVSCSRRHRTVVFERLSIPGRCTPTGHTFRGSLVALSSEQCRARYDIQYDYWDFVDSKYADERRYRGIEKGTPTWARVHFRIVCSNCGATRTQSTQSNVLRPWTCVCPCGAELYDDAEPPKLGWHEVAT